MFDRRPIPFPVCAILLVAALTVPALAPLAGALEMQHLLASQDADQGTHSESDLCVWVAVHVSGASVCRPAPETPLLRSPHTVTMAVPGVERRRAGTPAPSRAPPLFR